MSNIEEILSNVPTGQLEDIRVLFAEDSEDILNLFKFVSAKLQWQGLYATNAIEMMDVVNDLIAKGFRLDGVVADINFLSGPKVTGVTAVREIRKVMPNVPVIFITGYVTSIIREEVRRIGAEIVAKPFDLDVLFNRLSQLIIWNRVITAKQPYDGEERRRNSVNRTEFQRRATDYVLSTPDRIAETLDSISRDKEKCEEKKSDNATPLLS